VIALGLVAALLAQAASSISGLPPSPSRPAPCAACVTWRASPAVARQLLEPPGPLDGLDVLLVVDSADDVAAAAAMARELTARRATAGFELPLSPALDLAPLSAASSIVLVVPPSAVAGDALVFEIQTRATAARAAAPDAVIGLAGPSDRLRAIPAAALAAYVSFLAPADVAAAPTEDPAAGQVARWTPGTPPASVAGLLEETAHRPGARLVLTLRDRDVPLARRLALFADVFPAGLTLLDSVSVCSPPAEECAPVFLHPRTLEAVAIVDGPGSWIIRPGVTRATVRPLAGSGEIALPIARRDEGALIDGGAWTGPSVLRLEGWAGGEAGFASAVEVSAARRLTVAEILAAHQAQEARQAARVRTLVATGKSVLSFQIPGLAAPMTVTAESVLFRQGNRVEIAQRDLRLNGVEIAVGDDGVPRLPLVQPERVAAPPLSIALGEAYRYRRDGEERHGGRACYVVAFEPRDGLGPSFRGRAWIARDSFALVRLVATQTGLRGAIVSSRQEDEFRPIEVGDAEAWLLVRSDVEQIYEGPGHRTPIDRHVVFDRLEVDAEDFEARLAAARASRAVMMRETADGFRYLRRTTPAPLAPSSGTSLPDDPAAGPRAAPEVPEGGRLLAGRATRVWSVAAGTLFDPDIDRPLVFAGLSYLDFDVLGTGAQMNAFLAGPFAQIALSVPSVGGPGLQIQAWAFASLLTYNDRSFRGGLERYDENLRQRPLRASVAFLKRLGPRTRVRAAYEFEAIQLGANDTTAADFRVPKSPVAHALRLGLEWERGRWSATLWGSAARRQQWGDWGRPGDFEADARDYQRAGVTLTRSFLLSSRASARLEVSGLAGRHLDRFSRFSFDAFDNRLRGYPSAGVRFDRGAVLRTAGTWSLRPGLRLDGFVDAAVVRDPTAGDGSQGHLGTGAAVETALPGRFLLSAEWGFGWEARRRDGGRGTNVVRLTVYKVL
jgi:hypothetical protein